MGKRKREHRQAVIEGSAPPYRGPRNRPKDKVQEKVNQAVKEFMSKKFKKGA